MSTVSSSLGRLLLGLVAALAVMSAVPAVSHATPGGLSSSSARSLTITLTLRRTDQRGFERFLRRVEDPGSPQFRHFRSPRALAARFGPSAGTYRSARAWLRGQGLRIVQGSRSRLTVSATGSRARVERALHVQIRDHRIGSRIVYGNAQAPVLPRALADHVQAVSGLSDAAQPSAAPSDQWTCNNRLSSAAANVKVTTQQLFCENLCLKDLTSSSLAGTATDGIVALASSFLGSLAGAFNGLVLSFYCLGTQFANATPGIGVGMYPPDKPSKTPLRGARAAAVAPQQKIGLLEFDTFRPSDVADWLALTGIGGVSASQVHQVHVNGGVATPGAGEAEVLVDVDTVLGMSQPSAANVVVYDAPPSTSFVQMFQAMVDDGDTVISNSWSQCEDQTSLADARAIDSVLANAAASGITVLNGTGDSGSTCLDGAANTIGVPADSPHATAVGGTTPTPGPGLTYGGERWWDNTADTPAGGAGGYGVSRYFDRPAYQNGLTASATRSVPDLAVDADPHAGLQICKADAGGCPNGLQWGGTSMAAPAVAALVADLNVAIGRNVGDLNAAVYPLAGSAFRPASALSSDFAHVGLGSPDFGAVARLLTGTAIGAVSTAKSTIGTLGGPQADGHDAGVVRVSLRDANGNPVAGKAIAVTATGGAHVTATRATTGADGGAAFSVTDTGAETVTFTATDTSDAAALTAHPAMTFVAPVASGATVVATPDTVVNDGTTKTTVSVYLQDALGRPAAGKTVALRAGGGSAVISPASHQAVTGADGAATFTATDFASESVSLTATDVTDGNLPVPGAATVDFQPAGSPSCVDTPPAPAPGSGLGISTFASGVPDNDHAIVTFSGGITFTGPACVGVRTPAFDASGNVFVPSPISGLIYQFGPAGGVAGPASALPDSTFGSNELAGGLAFGKDGELYASRYAGGDQTKPEIVQLDPATGAVKRVVATSAMGLPDFPTYLAVDPISGDLFSVDDGSGAGTGNDNVTRIAHPDSATPTLSPYANVGGVQTGLTFAPDGTLYVGVVTGAHINTIVAATATNSAAPGTVSEAATLPNPPFGVGVSETTGAGHASALIVVEAGGNVDRVDLSAQPATVTTLASRPYAFSSGGAIGADGCLYFNDQDKVLRVTGVGPACPGGAPTASGPQLTLTEDGSATPPTGTPVSFTATLGGVAAPQGTPIVLEVSGPNPSASLVDADAGGAAAFHYAGVFAGVDRVRARATVNGRTITSAPIIVHWVAGQDTSFLSLNASRTAGGPGRPVTLTANLTDITQEPPVAVTGAAVTLALAGRSCTATTDGAGTAACTVAAPDAIGLHAVTASYDGSATLTAAHASNVFSTASPATGPVPSPGPGPSPGTGAAAKPAAVTPSLALSCTGASIVLINVLERGRRVAISGAARLALAGKHVTIHLAGAKKALATALIARDGTFATTVPLPAKKIRDSDKARYTATVGSAHSAALKLTRRLVITRSSAASGRVHLAGTVGRPLVKGAKLTIRRRTTCHAYKTVAVVKIARSGAWSASLPARAAAVYRAQTKVRGGGRTVTTYSLPIPVAGG